MLSNQPLTPADISQVSITDPFWSKIMETVRTKVIPYQWEALNDRIEGAEPSHCIENFKIAGKITKNAAKGIYERDAQDKFQGFVFQDSDLAKWIEAVGYSLMNHRDEELEAIADDAISIICEAQQPDGYLNTYYIINGLENRFTNLRDHHELYCLGHFIEGAVSYYQATGKDKLLNAVKRYADLVDRTFGPEPGKKKGYPGHEIIEMALVRLYEVTKEKRYLKLAKYFIDERGKAPNYFAQEEKEHNRSPLWHDSYFKYQYSQAGKPVREQTEAEGHAVRAVYLYSGMADVARQTQDEELMNICERLWDNITTKRMYITGGIGSSSYGEAFTYDYDLPNDTVYAETCASIGLAFFANRMLRANPNSKYADVMEKAFYNGIISGMSLDGTKFFYVNPLEVIPEASKKDQWHRHVTVERQRWFGCACCPPNLARILSSLGQYTYGTSKDTIYVHLFLSSNYNTNINGRPVQLKVQTEYPWKNTVTIDVNLEKSHYASEGDSMNLAIRVPGWCRESSFMINGESVTPKQCNGYAILTRDWKSGDRITYGMAMPVVTVASNPKVRDNIGKLAVMRGPLVYCLEEADNEKDLHRIYLDPGAQFEETYDSGLLGGIVKLTCGGYVLDDSAWNNNTLYEAGSNMVLRAKPITFIPYYSWANRTPGEMLVWVHAINYCHPIL